MWLVLLFSWNDALCSCSFAKALRKEGTSGDHLVQPSSAQMWVNCIRLCRAIYSCVLNMSRDGDSSTTFGSLCLTTLTLREKNNPKWKAKQPSKKHTNNQPPSPTPSCSPPFPPSFLNLNFLYFNIGLLPHFCHFISLKRVWHYFFTPSCQIFIHSEKFP